MTKTTRLEDIGFYTLSTSRARHASSKSPLVRGELLITSRCNFCCPYCRSRSSPDISQSQALSILDLWNEARLQNVRFSGGEPTLHPNLPLFCLEAKKRGVQRVAISSNGSAEREVYASLLEAGADDFSISLDACCAADCERMAGGVKNVFEKIIENIHYLSQRAYTTVGVVLTQQNIGHTLEIIELADSLGVHDIRIIPAAQHGKNLPPLNLPAKIVKKYRILRYRARNIVDKVPVRGISEEDSPLCTLALDDIAADSEFHYPCVIYLRERGRPIGKVIDPRWRTEREKWVMTHNSRIDPICKGSCLDVCIAYNNVADDKVRREEKC